MDKLRFTNITNVNGFDTLDKDNARQNNYAWSMAEFGDYIYAGTARNVLYFVCKKDGEEPPKSTTPEKVYMGAEIWRCSKKSEVKTWERVYKTPSDVSIIGFRSMITFTNDKNESALYIGCASSSAENSYMLKTTDGINFEFVQDFIPKGYNARSLGIHNGKLYVGAVNDDDYKQDSYLYYTTDDKSGWQQVNFGDSENKPKGEIFSMVSFNGFLYIGTGTIGGCTVWKSEKPEEGNWKCVLDKGAGDALNEVAMSLEVFNDHIYVGTAIMFGYVSVDPSKKIVPIKGFDIIRIDKSDKWEVIVGKEPISPTNPTTGVRKNGLYESGFGNIFAAYCWKFGVFNNRFFVGTFDSAYIYYDLIEDMLKNKKVYSFEDILEYLKKLNFPPSGNYNVILWTKALLKSLAKYPYEFGANLYISEDGKNYDNISKNGLRDKYNIGIRNFVAASDGRLYIGTANPYKGCEVWTCDELDKKSCECTDK